MSINLFVNLINTRQLCSTSPLPLYGLFLSQRITAASTNFARFFANFSLIFIRVFHTFLWMSRFLSVYRTNTKSIRIHCAVLCITNTLRVKYNFRHVVIQIQHAHAEIRWKIAYWHQRECWKWRKHSYVWRGGGITIKTNAMYGQWARKHTWHERVYIDFTFEIMRISIVQSATFEWKLARQIAAIAFGSFYAVQSDTHCFSLSNKNVYKWRCRLSAGAWAPHRNEYYVTNP